MRELADKSKKAQEERERQRIITERKKARSESIKKQNQEYSASAEEPHTDAGPLDLQKLIKDLAKIHAEIENVELPQEPLRPESEYMPTIQKEVKLLMRLDHPNVIKTYKIFDSEDECYIIMELAKGGELMEYITAHGKLTEKEARKFFRQIVSAMDHIHSANIVHRDLKLENVLLSKDIDCLISDFGLGRTYQNETADDMKTFCGTPNYASIELVAGIPYNGVKSDIWAMGVILYIMVSGKRPFAGSTLAVLYQRILKLDYEIPPYFSSELIDLLKRIFVRDPKKRIDVHSIRDHPWMNIDYNEKIVFVPAKPALEDAEGIGKVIGGVYNDNDFMVYVLKAHSSSQMTSPNASVSSMKIIARNFSNTSSHRMETDSIKSSKSVTEYQHPHTKGRRASLQEHGRESKSFALPKKLHLHSEIISIEEHSFLPRNSKTDEHFLLMPSSFSNELSRKPSISSVEARKMSETHISRRSIGRGSSSIIKSPMTDGENDLLDVSDADAGRPRRLSVGPDKRATIEEEDPLVLPTSSTAPKAEVSATSSNNHEENSRKDYSFARKPSYRRTSIGESTRPLSILLDQPIILTNTTPKDSSARHSVVGGRTDSLSSRAHVPLITSSNGVGAAVSVVLHNSEVQQESVEPTNRVRKRAATVSGAPITRISGKSADDEKKLDAWEDQESSKGGSKRSSKLSTDNRDEREKYGNQIITMEMITDWHQTHRPARTIRTMRYSFNKSTTSSIYEPPRIFQDLHKTLLDMADAGKDDYVLKFSRPGDLYLFECTVDYLQKEEGHQVKFDVEVCKVWLLEMNGIRIKRLQGDLFDYKQLNTDLVERLGYNG